MALSTPRAGHGKATGVRTAFPSTYGDCEPARTLPIPGSSDGLRPGRSEMAEAPARTSSLRVLQTEMAARPRNPQMFPVNAVDGHISGIVSVYQAPQEARKVRAHLRR